MIELSESYIPDNWRKRLQTTKDYTLSLYLLDGFCDAFKLEQGSLFNISSANKYQYNNYALVAIVTKVEKEGEVFTYRTYFSYDESQHQWVRDIPEVIKANDAIQKHRRRHVY